MPKKKKKKRFLIAKLLRIYYVRRFSVTYCMNVRTSQKKAWRTLLNDQCDIKYRLQYSLFFTFLNYNRNRLFLYFLVNYRISIISLLFWLSIPNPGCSYRFLKNETFRARRAIFYLHQDKRSRAHLDARSSHAFIACSVNGYLKNNKSDQKKSRAR